MQRTMARARWVFFPISAPRNGLWLLLRCDSRPIAYSNLRAPARFRAHASSVGAYASDEEAGTRRVRFQAGWSVPPVLGVAAMPKQKVFRVIPGGKPSDAAAADPMTLDTRQLLDRARRYRRLLSTAPSNETESLVSDLEDAIDAFRRLHQSSEAGAQTRAAEYRRLIAELDAEIVAALRASPPS